MAHNCHGKRKNLAAKRKASRQKEQPRGKKKSLTAKRKTSRQKEKPHGKKKNLTAKRKTPRQKEKPHGKKKNFAAKRILTSRQKENSSRQKEKPRGEKKSLTAKRKTSRRKEKESLGVGSSSPCQWPTCKMKKSSKGSCFLFFARDRLLLKHNFCFLIYNCVCHG